MIPRRLAYVVRGEHQGVGQGFDTTAHPFDSCPEQVARFFANLFCLVGTCLCHALADKSQAKCTVPFQGSNADRYWVFFIVKKSRRYS